MTIVKNGKYVTYTYDFDCYLEHKREYEELEARYPNAHFGRGYGINKMTSFENKYPEFHSCHHQFWTFERCMKFMYKHCDDDLFVQPEEIGDNFITIKKYPMLPVDTIVEKRDEICGYLRLLDRCLSPPSNLNYIVIDDYGEIRFNPLDHRGKLNFGRSFDAPPSDFMFDILLLKETKYKHCEGKLTRFINKLYE